MFESLLDRVLNLALPRDRQYLLQRMAATGHGPHSPTQIEGALKLLAENLGQQWVTVHPGEVVAISIGEKATRGLGLFSEIIPLGLALLRLSELTGFEKLLEKLRVRSHERLSTILEAVSAANYRLAGYLVELEPATETGHSCDFRVCNQTEWIYFECKKENVRASNYWAKRFTYAKGLIKRITAATLCPPTHRIDIILPKRRPAGGVQILIDEIRKSIDQNEFKTWKDVEGIRVAVNLRSVVVNLPPSHVQTYAVDVGTTSTKAAPENAGVQVIYNPFGPKEKQKISRIIREARDQLPTSARGIIILDVEHTKEMVSVAEEKLRQPGYQHVIGILLTGNGAWFTPNPVHASFPLEFAVRGVIPPPQEIPM